MRISDWSSDVCSSDLINDLKYHACIQGTADVWHFIVDDKLVDFRPKGPLRVNSGTAVADAALASFGICQLPDFYVEPYINSGSLRSEEHTSELQSLMRTSYAVFCLKKKKKTTNTIIATPQLEPTTHRIQISTNANTHIH